MLAATALVLFMTPGLAFFYGGMVRAKNVLGMLMQNFFAMGLLGVLWVVVGYTLAFGGSGNWIGNLDHLGLRDVTGVASAAAIPAVLFAAYPDDLRDHHPCTHHRCDRRPPEVLRLRDVHRAVARARLRPGGQVGVRRRLAGRPGGARLRGRRGGAHQRRRRRAGGGARDRQAQGLPGHADAAPQPALDAARHGDPVVRLGGLQRRLGARRQRGRGPGDPEHLRRRVGGDAGLAPRRAAQGGPSRPPSGALRARSPGWWPSHRAPASSGRWRPW